MHPVFYYIIIFLVLGGVGMALGSLHASTAVKKQRWKKYYMYIFITGTIIIGIFQHFYYWLAWLVVLAACLELVKVNSRANLPPSLKISSFLVFGAVAAGFLLFSKVFDPMLILFIYFQVLVFDGFCQVSGQLFGKHALAPRISPTKTWEGLAGGWAAGICAAILAAGWLDTVYGTITTGMVSGVLTGIFASIGDLIASWYKRKTQVKDYSSWLPGQGGFLDRFDSFLFTGAVYYLIYFVIFKSSFASILKG